MIILILFLASISPFVLWPIEIFFPYPHIVEELAKALLIFFLLKSPKTNQKIIGSLLIGLLFTLSETFLYMLSTTSSQILVQRILWTMPMHITTSIVILTAGLIHKRLIFVGIVLAILIHYLFNTYIGSFVV